MFNARAGQNQPVNLVARTAWCNKTTVVPVRLGESAAALTDNFIRQLRTVEPKGHTLGQAHTCERLGGHGLGVVHLHKM
jgi:hypothetical protein